MIGGVTNLQQEMPANLADDSVVGVDVHLGTIFWNGDELDVAVLAMGTRPLLGTALLAGHRLTADFVDGGQVALEPV